MRLQEVLPSPGLRRAPLPQPLRRRGASGRRYFPPTSPQERRLRAGGLTERSTSRQRGSITIWGIGLTLVIAAFAGLVIDTWRVFAERQDLSGMADSAAIAGATAVDIDHLNETGEIILALDDAEMRALQYLEHQDGWSSDITFAIVAAPDGSEVTVVLEKDVDFTLLGPLLPGEAPLRITVTSQASPNVVDP